MTERTHSSRSQLAATRRQTDRPAANSGPVSLESAAFAGGLASPIQVLTAQRALGNRAVQRWARRSVQRKPVQEGELDSNISAALNQSRGGGQPLPDRLRGSMESAFQSDFGGVRVHADQQADTLNRSVQAKAFTLGSDIYFRKGNYQPGSSSGQELLAHELTHVVQQGGTSNRVQGKLTLGPVGDRYEQEADRVAKQVMRGDKSTGVQLHSFSSANSVIQGKFSPEEIARIEKMSGEQRVEYLSRVSPEDLASFIETDYFDRVYGASEEMDEIRANRKKRPEPEEGFSKEWLDPVPAGNARAAALNLALLDAGEEIDIDQLLTYRETFLTLMRRRVKVAYLEDCEFEENARVPGYAKPVPHYKHPASDIIFYIAKPGQAIYLMGYVIASKHDSVEAWTKHLLDMVARSGESSSGPEPDDEEDDEMAALISGLGSLSLGQAPLGGLPSAKPGQMMIEKTSYDADGDVIMTDVQGNADVDMHDVHGQMDVEMTDVDGTVDMDVDNVRGDIHVSVSDISGDVHLVLMDIDLSDDSEEPHYGAMDVDVKEVGGSLDVEIIDVDEPVDHAFGPIASGEKVVKRVSKRPRAESESDEPTIKKRRPLKKRKIDPSALPQFGDEEDFGLAALTEKFAGLSISFPSGLDHQDHLMYTSENLDDVIIKSDPTPLSVIIKVKKWLGKAIPAADINTLKTHQKDIKLALQTVKQGATQGANAALRKAMSHAAKFLATFGTVPLPVTNLTKSANHNVAKTDIVGKRLIADPLSPRSKQPGSKAQDGDLMTALRQKVVANGGLSQDPIQAHLLNMKTYGPGELWNLTPASKLFNSDMERDLETPLKAAIYEKGLLMHFEADVHYNNYPIKADHKTNPERYLFTKIVFSAHQLHEDVTNSKYAKDITIADDPLIQALNQTMNWKQGNLPALATLPNAHTSTSPADFIGLAWPPSVVEALTDYNKNVKVGAAIPNSLATRAKWSGNVAKTKFLSDLNDWLKNKAYTGKQKAVAQKLPDNWKKQLDWS